MPDKLEALRLAAVKLDEAKDAELMAMAAVRTGKNLDLALAELAKAKLAAEQADRDYATALEELHSGRDEPAPATSKPGSSSSAGSSARSIIGLDDRL